MDRISTLTVEPTGAGVSATTSLGSTKAVRAATIHPLWLRATHWLNAIAVVLMATSGWRIYNASPIYDMRFPGEMTLGGWLGGALQWHFAGMWLLAFNSLVYLALNLASGRFRSKFFPLSAGGVWGDIRDALRGRLSHSDHRRYNGLQRVAYLAAIVDLALLILSGLVQWKSVQFPLLRELLGGYEGARRVHFFAMATLVAFAAGHVLMVALVPRTLITMIRGR